LEKHFVCTKPVQIVIVYSCSMHPHIAAQNISKIDVVLLGLWSQIDFLYFVSSSWLFWFGLDKCQVPTKTALALPLLSWAGERRYDERLQGRDKDRERSLTSYCHGQNRLNLGRRGKFNLQDIFPPPLPSSGARLHSHFSPFSPRVAQGDGEWGLWSVHHMLSLPLLPPQGRTPHTLPLLQHGVPLTATVLHELLQRGSFPRGAVLREQAAPVWVPTGSQALPTNLLQRGLLSPRVCRSWQEPATVRAPHRITASFRHPPAPVWGSFHGLQVEICSTVDLRGLQRDNLPHHGLHHELQGKTLLRCLEHLLPLLLHWPWCLQSCFFHIVSLLSLHCCLTPSFFFRFLKYVIPEVLPLSLNGLALASGGSVLERAGTGCIRHGGSFSQLLTEANDFLTKIIHSRDFFAPTSADTQEHMVANDNTVSYWKFFLKVRCREKKVYIYMAHRKWHCNWTEKFCFYVFISSEINTEIYTSYKLHKCTHMYRYIHIYNNLVQWYSLLWQNF